MRGAGIMAIQWTDDLATGVAEIDDQHKELFERIDRLFRACNQAQGRLEIGKTVAFLEEYVDTHFTAEEEIMQERSYPDYDAHKAQHAYFRNNLLAIRQQLDEEGPGVHIVILTNRLVVDWLRNHIRKLDRAFGNYLQDWQ
jgi:hemerythrin